MRGANDIGRPWPRLVVVLVVVLVAFGSAGQGGCGQSLDLGSDVVWSALHEGGTFDEWLASPGGKANASPAPNTVEISSERAHRGGFAAKLSLNAVADGVQHNAGLSRLGLLPPDAFYSAWFYLPRTVTVGAFWVIVKFRIRTSADDAATEAELLDLNLANLPNGEMTLRLYSHRDGDLTLDVPDPVVPVGRWFQIEAFYRNAPDATGRTTYWLDGRMIADLTGKATGPTPWIQWVACSVAEGLTPSAEVLYIDDAAISLRRVGPEGQISW